MHLERIVLYGVEYNRLGFVLLFALNVLIFVFFSGLLDKNGLTNYVAGYRFFFFYQTSMIFKVHFSLITMSKHLLLQYV